MTTQFENWLSDVFHDDFPELGGHNGDDDYVKFRAWIERIEPEELKKYQEEYEGATGLSASEEDKP
jgi:hypothetical protein